MPRAERLLELTDLLRSLDTTTVAQLAAQLGTSRRTISRDLASLRERGLPISGEAGPGGGIRLEGERGLLAVHLTLGEIVSLWLTARLAREASELPWGGSASAALTKLLASLPASRARALRAICQRVIVGEPATANLKASLGVAPPELLALFETAFTTGRGLAFRYVDRKGRRTSRRVEPHGLLVVTPAWYVLARDVDTGEPRMFRVDRMKRPRMLSDISFQPDQRVVRDLMGDLPAWRPLSGRW
ncbi:MAG: transcriptional regulator [Archangium gephyra]|uniref:Transcriptional regulator n=1 Tax=Archangium gephyra TaxID=48 RepID=A0A2W5VD18_9BACT|nr:MAG: transcriptional regulator [Archangium gephyra]